MAGIFEFGLQARDLWRLRKLFIRSPKLFARAAVNVINEFAFGTRTESLSIIGRTMTVRNRRFVKGSIWVDPQRGVPPLRSVVATVGSLRRERFTGWAEQQYGRSIGRRGTRFRQATMEARLGNERRQMVPRARMKPGPPIPSPRTRVRSRWRFSDTPQLRKATMMLIALGREGYKGPFILDDHPKFPPGLYRFKGRKGGRPRVRLLQLFTTKKSSVKKIPWLTMARERATSGNKGREAWGRAVNRVLPKRLR